MARSERLGGGVLKKHFVRAGSAPRPNPYRFEHHFRQTREFTDKLYPFHIPSKERGILLTTVNALSSK